MGDAFFIGTCRLIEPARHLRKALRKPALPMRHRLHNVHQIEQAIRLMLGEPAFEAATIHLMSERSCKEALDSAGGPDGVLADFASLGRIWREHEVFVIEVSSVKDFHVESGDGRLSVNTHAERDLGRHSAVLEERIAAGLARPIRSADVLVRRIDETEMLAAMRRIKRLAGNKPVLWVSHTNVVDPDDDTRKLYETRASLSKALQSAATELGDLFFDPTQVVRELGRSVAFADGGRDLFHHTRAAIEYLAEKYWGLCLEAARDRGVVLDGIRPGPETDQASDAGRRRAP